ncbi:hypothetical protein [Pseudoduganella umbonata]|uniref:M48 family metalloprotease n=1 Tax=Pseudoduganella umbonata TaxID=864828 RepID=A0ABX5UJV8_9BURK|nr:hypothetical protein [Pseudoduganella umbonata]QCP12087.1 hypothetical protein FCL38_17950 [Pseudoduganella umbonata]
MKSSHILRRALFNYFLITLLGASGPSIAQVPTLCVSQHLALIKKDGKQLGIAPDEASELIGRVARSIGLSQTVTTVPCHFFSKAAAWNARDNAGIPDGDYVIYNPDWVREVIGSDRTQAIALFGHELGHFVNRHFDTRQYLSSIDKEKEADRFAGCAVARLKGDFAALDNLFKRLRGDVSADYPDRLSSLESARGAMEIVVGTQQGAVAVQNTGWSGGARKPLSPVVRTGAGGAGRNRVTVPSLRQLCACNQRRWR